ncbi:energy-coupling factor ABC transporter permease [Entomomonas sp. E2T0]|uniref:energy-coupling factor ABC transporter permease n=1 Tax=Entomomonas sp. E2T0 TaxID=2930213 RepID=UPI0022281FD9|nr:energy-coupling factor ABC transporter permease [Entomomonas sp. E2T0]UYZ82682.1 energy-coupling factor ABC transporter permease [Entomomonas sp. E2T0]
MNIRFKRLSVIGGAALLVLFPQQAFAMHIMEGFLPPVWAGTWWAIYIPFLILGIYQLKKISTGSTDKKVLLALCAAFVFVLSSLKMPSVTGSCSHPTGVGLGVVMFGPWVMAVLAGIVLLFQALFLAHGGLTTLGANGMSMAVFGPVVGYYIWRISCKFKIRKDVGVFLCAFTADIVTYFVTSIQLAGAFPDPQLGFVAAATKFMSIFCLTQIPIAIAEGLLTVIIYNVITERKIAPAGGFTQ